MSDNAPDNSFSREQRLFLEALEQPEHQREGWLADACGENQRLYKDVAALLALEAASMDPLDQGIVGVDLFATVEYDRSSSDNDESDGLRILCPHCCNPIGMLVNTADEDVTCGSCGGAFNLVSNAEATISAESFQTLGRFELVSRLGFGGFGTVWKARDPQLERTVALKIPRRSTVSPEETEQFFREAKAAAQLRHPNILPVHEIGQCDGTIFIVSDFIRGVSLADRLTGKNMIPRHAVKLCRKIAMALEHAHESGIIHRDLKPSNVMLDESGEPIIMDFGLAKRETTEVTISGDGQIMGTPSYMSPEQAGGDGQRADRRTDIYSLGVMLFRMLSGELPFRGNTQMQIHQRLTEDAPSPRSLNNHIPRDLATICLKCLEREPESRYATAHDLADELQRFLDGEPILARPVSQIEKVWRWAKRKPAVATAVLLGTLVGVGGPLIGWRMEAQQRQVDNLTVDRNAQVALNVKDQSRTRIDELNAELNMWRGKANPWSYWPPQKNHWLTTLFRRVHDQEYARLSAQAVALDGNSAEKAYSEFALSLLTESAADSAKTKQHLSAAIRECESLQEQDPTNSEWKELLAEAYLRLAKVYHEEQMTTDQAGQPVRRQQSKDKTRQYLAKARNLYQQLYEEKTSLRYQAKLLDLMLRQSLHGGYDDAVSDLTAAQEISRQLESDLANDLRGLVKATRSLRPLE